jgi:5-methylcytosine-specific restriction endonuclease McrA
MICKQCNSEFDAKHFNQSLCSDECKKLAKSAVKARYKKTAKGVESENRWRKSPRKKSTDQKYYTSEKGRATAVRRQTRLLSNNIYYLDRKRLGQRAEYRQMKSRIFAIHDCCQNCGSKERLTIDHIKPMSLGGKHEPDNIQVLCLSCNASKGQKEIRY